MCLRLVLCVAFNNVFSSLQKMAESKEYRTIINCERKLELALKDDRDAAHFLHKHGFITKEIYDDTNLPTPKLVAAIRDRVELNPRNYQKFVEYLCRNTRRYEDIIDILKKEYESIPSASAPYQPSFQQGIYVWREIKYGCMWNSSYRNTFTK